MGWRVLADLVVLVHVGFVVFVTAGGPLVRWRPAVAWVHLPALAWAAGILAVGYTCPLTVLEAYFRRRAGQQPYPGGFVDHYIENVLYPERLTPVLLALAAAVILWGYAPLTARRRTPHRLPARPTPPPRPADPRPAPPTSRDGS